MLQRLLRLWTTRPDLLTEHARAYADLVAQEAARASAQWQRRAMLLAAGLCGLALGAVLAGVGLLLWAVLPLDQLGPKVVRLFSGVRS